MRAIPFGQRGNRLLEVGEVQRGLACGCVCPDPLCGRQLVARQGPKVAWHFAHYGETASRSIGCGGVESALHRFAKQYISESLGKVFPLPKRSSAKLYGGYEGAIKIERALQEFTVPGTARRCDVLIEGFIRKRPPTPRGQQCRWVPWDTRSEVAVEINVTNPKDEAYIEEVSRTGQLSVVELTLTPEDVKRRVATHQLSIAWSQAVKMLIMGRSSNRRWLFRRGSSA